MARFPKFEWPRIDAPFIRPGADMDALESESLRQARAAFEATRTTSRALSPNRSRAKAATGIFGRSFSQRCASCATNTTRC
ncbi:putative L-lysine-epsilon aminotransferase domain protein [Mycobacterium xenopi 4042]|uniref:Putative L-lysine-epsilon aminotransferase domain protein n=1 Tax=Mycobacterium xenopi 4042 TaxID=1299334 RepID=X7YIM3_MYCXE|nr:putative L-lysine-epsilon aminotransferase domain protein [Mycobacterium xenopi 4042]